MDETKIKESSSQDSLLGKDSTLSGHELVSNASKLGMERCPSAAYTEGSRMMINGSNGVGGTRNGIGALVGRKKRGRPRKFDNRGNLIRPYVSPPSLHALRPEHLQPCPTINLSPFDDVSSRRCLGSLPGLGQPKFLGSLGETHAHPTVTEFMPHVIEVFAGEDVIGKILGLFGTGPRYITIFSAIGIVYKVIIRYPGFSSSNILWKYEGQYQILCLSGSYTISKDNRIQTEGFSVLLAGSDGCVIGGTLAGSLLAATSIQIVVGSFIPNGFNNEPKKMHQYQVPTSHKPFQTHGEAKYGGTTYNSNHNPKINGLLPSWSVHSCPDLNVEAPIE